MSETSGALARHFAHPAPTQEPANCDTGAVLTMYQQQSTFKHALEALTLRSFPRSLSLEAHSGPGARTASASGPLHSTWALPGPRSPATETGAPSVRMPESRWLSSGFRLKDRAPGQIKVGPGRVQLHSQIIIIACTFFNELSFPFSSRNTKFSPLQQRPA